MSMFIHSVKKYLPITYDMPDTVPKATSDDDYLYTIWLWN